MIKYTSEPEWITAARLRHARRVAEDEARLLQRLEDAQQRMKDEDEAARVERFGKHSRGRPRDETP